MGFIVALDGPAGSGKGTVTKEVAKRMNLINIDTGAMYRCVTLLMIRQNVKLDELEKIQKILDDIHIQFKVENENQKVCLNNEDVSLEIRTQKVNELVSPVSTIKIVRDRLADLQRKMAESIDVIMEGRDIGTTVFPNADVKIYLDATPEERARRRVLQNEEKGIVSSYEEVLENIKDRDKRDSTREIAPLKRADDAIYVDSTNLNIEQVVEKIIGIINDKNIVNFEFDSNN